MDGSAETDTLMELRMTIDAPSGAMYQVQTCKFSCLKIYKTFSVKYLVKFNRSVDFV